MKRTLALVAAATLALSGLSLAACDAPRSHLQKRAVAVKHLQDGRWAYQADNGDWYLYYVILNGQQTPYTGDTAPTVGSSYGGGEITLAETNSISQADLAGAVETTVDVSFGAESSAPASAAEVASDVSVDFGAESSASSSDSSSSSDAGSSAGDSGGGGGDGGGGGGDGGE